MNRNHLYALMSLAFVSQALPFITEAAPSPYLTQEARMHTATAHIEAGAELTGSVSGETEQSPELVVITRASLAETTSISAAIGTEDTTQTTASTISSITPPTSIQAHARSIMVADTHVTSVSSSQEVVSLSYLIPNKVLGIFSIMVPVQLSVGLDGIVRTTYPWYGFLAPIPEVAVTLHSQTAVDTILRVSNPSSTVRNSDMAVRTGFSATEQVAILDALHVEIQTDAKTLLGSSRY